MGNGNQLFTPGERRAAGLAILAALVVSLSGVALETAFRPSLGLYDLNGSVASLPNVIDASPLSAS